MKNTNNYQKIYQKCISLSFTENNTNFVDIASFNSLKNENQVILKLRKLMNINISSKAQRADRR